jgi:hypothetical protein
MSDLNLSILGFPAVNRDLTVELRDPAADVVVKTAQPFLDGTVRIAQLDPGAYELAVFHPNLTLPVLQRPIRVLPTGDTRIQVLIDPSKFRSTPIVDIPDANLGPVRDAAQGVAETALPLAQKQPGEAITASDWNAIASGIRELALALTELTRLVTPVGHNHTELETKIEEISGNFTSLLETLSAAMTELQRQIQAERFRKQVEDVLTAGGIERGAGPGRELLDAVGQLTTAVTDTPTRFGRVARTTGIQLSTKLEQILDEKADDETFINSNEVKQLSETVDLLKAQRATTYSSELEHLRKVDRTLGGGGLIDVLSKEG